MEGIIIIDKPGGWTSFDVVAKIRKLTRVKKVGHSGTLDPMATGVLPIFLGAATKYVMHFMNGIKGYVGEITLGIKTDSLDADGKILKKTKVQRRISEDKVKNLFQRFTGEIEQTPPMVSAIHYKGKRLYELARTGKVVPRPPRKVIVHELKFMGIEDGDFPKIKFYCSCSKGTYIRSLVSDIGDVLGFGAHLSRLRRVYSHPFADGEAHTIGAIEELIRTAKIDTIILNPKDFIEGQNFSHA